MKERYWVHSQVDGLVDLKAVLRVSSMVDRLVEQMDQRMEKKTVYSMAEWMVYM